MAKYQRLFYHLVIFCLFIIWANAFAATNDVPKVIAIQHRNYHLTDELCGFVSYLPLDSFTTYFAEGGSITHYFSDYLAWEIINGAYANSSSTGLREYLINNYTAVPDTYDIINYYFTTNVVYTPLYMKNLTFSSGIAYGDISFVGGGGITKYTAFGNVNTVDLGIILRYFVGLHSSLKFDIRNYFFLSADLKNNLAFSVGFAYNLGGGSEKNTTQDNDE